MTLSKVTSHVIDITQWVRVRARVEKRAKRRDILVFIALTNSKLYINYPAN